MRVLVTGIAGFAGSHLAELLLEQGWQVSGIVHSGEDGAKIAHIRDKLNLLTCDLNDRRRVREVLAATRSEVVFHLAAVSSVARSWSDPEGTFATNVLGLIHLLDAIRDEAPEATGVVVGSGEEYGPPDEIPITEGHPLRPANPYSASKVAGFHLCRQYAKAHGLRIVYLRPFNHIGPRQSLGFAVPDFASQIAAIEAGRQEPVMYVGNLEARRDLLDVRDMVRAYALAAEKGEPGEVYNIASGRPLAIQEVLDGLLKLSNRSIEVRRDPKRMRPSDVPVIAGDSAKFRRRTGWEPGIPVEDSLRDILDYWRGVVGEGEQT